MSVVSFVGSILNYAAEISGLSKSKDIERIHLKFCKNILKVRKSTSNATVYADLGRYPLYITRYLQIIKYWFKVINTNNVLLKKVYDFAKQDCLKGLNSGVSSVCRLLKEIRFSNVWKNPFSVNIKSFIPIFRQRILDNFIQRNMSKNEKSPSLVLYRQLKVAI